MMIVTRISYFFGGCEMVLSNSTTWSRTDFFQFRTIQGARSFPESTVQYSKPGAGGGGGEAVREQGSHFRSFQ